MTEVCSGILEDCPVWTVVAQWDITVMTKKVREMD